MVQMTTAEAMTVNMMVILLLSKHIQHWKGQEWDHLMIETYVTR